MLAEAADLEGSRDILTPLLDQPGSLQAEAAAILGELTAGENAAPPVQPVRPTPVRRAISPVPPPQAPAPRETSRETGPEAEVKPPRTARSAPPAKPAPAQPASRPARARTGLAPLPAALLAGLAEIAQTEGELTEAEYWRGALISAKAAEASASGDSADAGDDAGPGASVGPHHDGSLT